MSDALGVEPQPSAGRAKCPAEVKLAIKRAIALHIREYGRTQWNLVRERPEFAQWIGSASGEAGHRKFYRWVDELTKSLPEHRTGRHDGREINNEQFAQGKAEAEPVTNAAGLLPLSPRHLMASGPKVLEGFEQLGAMIAKSAHAIDLVEAAAVVDGQVIDPKLLLNAARSRASLALTGAALLRDYGAVWAQQEFVDRLILLLDGALAPHPELRDQVFAGVHQLVVEQGGVPPGSRPHERQA